MYRYRWWHINCRRRRSVYWPDRKKTSTCRRAARFWKTQTDTYTHAKISVGHQPGKGKCLDARGEQRGGGRVNT
jgi:hypothetical protein